MKCSVQPLPWPRVRRLPQQPPKRRQTQACQSSQRPLRNILIECAPGAHAPKTASAHDFHRATAACGYKKAIIAMANKLVHVIYIMLRDQREYRDPKVDYEEMMVQKNATHWFRQILRYQHLYYNDEGNLSTDLKARSSPQHPGTGRRKAKNSVRRLADCMHWRMLYNKAR